MPDSLQQSFDETIYTVPESLGMDDTPVMVLDTTLLSVYEPFCEEPVADTAVAVALPEWHNGLEPEPREIAPGRQNGFIFAIAVLLVLVLFNFKTLRLMLGFYIDELITVRHGRDNVFDERPTALSVIQLLLSILFIGCGGFLLASGVTSLSLHDHMLLSSGAVLNCIGIVFLYFIFELGAYYAVGYTFASEEGCREWIRGFSASTDLLAMAITVPAMIAIFYPTTSAAMAILAFILFILAKIVFILKGFRIFYDNFFSLLYFILYLCTLEIIPIILVYNCSVLFV